MFSGCPLPIDSTLEYPFFLLGPHLCVSPSFYIISNQATSESLYEPNSFLDCCVPCLFCLKDSSFLWLSWAALLPGQWASCLSLVPCKSVKTRQFVHDYLKAYFLLVLILWGRNSMNTFEISIYSYLATSVRMHKILESVWHRFHEHSCGPVEMWSWGSLLGT